MEPHRLAQPKSRHREQLGHTARSVAREYALAGSIAASQGGALRVATVAVEITITHPSVEAGTAAPASIRPWSLRSFQNSAGILA